MQLRSSLNRASGTVVVVSIGDFLHRLDLLLSIKHDIDLAVLSELTDFVGFDFCQSGTGLLGEPFHHSLLGALTAVFDLLSVAEEDEGGETLNSVGTLDAGVSIGINFGKTN
jgi:hypothetical protein